MAGQASWQGGGDAAWAHSSGQAPSVPSWYRCLWAGHTEPPREASAGGCCQALTAHGQPDEVRQQILVLSVPLCPAQRTQTRLLPAALGQGWGLPRAKGPRAVEPPASSHATKEALVLVPRTGLGFYSSAWWGEAGFYFNSRSVPRYKAVAGGCGGGLRPGAREIFLAGFCAVPL